jgi:hypothetical protein
VFLYVHLYVMLTVCVCVDIIYFFCTSVGDDDDQLEGENECNEESVDAPICGENYTFLPNCCAKITTCVECATTKAEIIRPTNADMAKNALRMDISKPAVRNCCDTALLIYSYMYMY